MAGRRQRAEHRRDGDPGPSSAAAGLPALDRHRIHDELRQRRETFHAILASSTAGELRRMSNGTRWNNQGLLFHMLFGYMVVVVLLRMIKVLGLLPRPTTKPFALLLNASTRPFNAINYWGSRLGPCTTTIDAWARNSTASPRHSPTPSTGRPTPAFAEVCTSRRDGTPSSNIS
jgi:hypothetical protein